MPPNVTVASGKISLCRFAPTSRTFSRIQAALASRSPSSGLPTSESGAHSQMRPPEALQVTTLAEKINAALFTVIFSAFVSSGQRCTCPRRLLLPDSPWGDDFLQQLVQRSSELTVAHGLSQPQPFMGALISSDAARHLQDGIRLLESLGGQTLLAPNFLNNQKTLMTPALIDMSRATQTFDEELFGPVLQVFRYRDRDDAIAQANATRFGLAAGLISDDSAAFDYCYRHLRAGIVNFNKPLTGASSEAPFGGIGASGNHRPSAYYAE